MNNLKSYLLVMALGVLVLGGVASAASYNPLYVNYFAINNTPTGNVFPVGATIPITVITNGGGAGTGYIYNWSIDSTTSCPGAIGYPINYTSSLSYNTILYTPTGSTSNCGFNVIVYDSASVENAISTGQSIAILSPNSNYSGSGTEDIGSIVIFSQALSASITSPSASVNLAAGQQILISATVSGGLSPYTYNFIVFNSTTDAVVGNELDVNVQSNSDTFSFTAPSSAIGNALVANVVITDSENPSQTASSSNSAVMTITPSSSATPTVTLETSNSILDAGQTETLTALVTGGSGLFTYSFYNVTGSTPVSCTSANTCSFITSGIGSFSYNVAVTDEISSTTVNSVENTITVYTAPTASFVSNTNSISVSSASAINSVSTPQSVTLSLPSGNTLNICATGAGGDWLSSVSWSANTTAQDSNVDPSNVLYDSPFVGTGALGALSSIGVQSNSICTATTTPAGPDIVLAGITVGNLNGYTTAVYSNATNGVVDANGVLQQSLPYTVTSSSSTTVIAIASGFTSLSSLPTLPSGCSIVQNVDGDGSESAVIAVCSNQAPGAYNVIVSTEPLTTGISEAAYVFTPSGSTTSVTLPYNSTTPLTENANVIGGTGNLAYQWTLNGITQPSTTNTITITFPLSAPGNYVLNVYAVDQGTTTPFVSPAASFNIIATGTSTPSGGSIGGGSSGSSGGGGGSPGGGGSSKPIITNITNGYDVSNIAQLNSFSLVMCGTTISVDENYISPTQAGITIDGQSYLLNQSQTESVTGASDGCSVKLLNISYIPIEQTITLQFTQNSTIVHNTTPPNTTTSNSVSNTIKQLNVSFAIGTADTIKVNAGNYSKLVNISRVITYPPNAPAGYTIFSVFNITVSKTLNVTTVSLTESFECGLTGLQPFIIQNGTWNPITNYSVNSTACTITFAIPADPVIALGQSLAAASPVLKKPVTTTVQPIIVIVPESLQKVVSQATRDAVGTVLVIVGIMAIIGGAYSVSLNKKRKKYAYKAKAKKGTSNKKDQK